MYQYLKKLLEVAEEVGSVKNVDMGEWIPGMDRICISGKSRSGKPYELELSVGESSEKSGTFAEVAE